MASQGNVVLEMYWHCVYRFVKFEVLQCQCVGWRLSDVIIIKFAIVVTII